MSIESVRARLDRYFEYAAFAAGRGVVGSKTGERLRQGYHDFSAHAPTDLRLALDVLQGAKDDHHRRVPREFNAAGEEQCSCGWWTCGRLAALDALEGAP